MGVALYTNNASSTLAAGINAAVTSFLVATGQGALFPNPTGGDYFYVTLSDAASGLVIEICKCTARSTDTLTVTRGSQGTTPAAFLIADKVELRPTATGFTELAALGGTNTYTGYQALAAGAVGTPSLYLSTDTTTGLYRIGANNDGFAVSGAKVLDIASTGLSVTGTLSATGLTTLGASSQGVQIDRVSDAIGYGLITLNGVYASTTTCGIYGRGSGGDSGKLFITGIGSVVSQIAGVTVTSVTSTGLAVTGTLSATGAITGNATAGGNIISHSSGYGLQITAASAVNQLRLTRTGSATADFRQYVSGDTWNVADLSGTGGTMAFTAAGAVLFSAGSGYTFKGSGVSTSAMFSGRTANATDFEWGPDIVSSSIYRVQNSGGTGVYLTSGNTAWTANSDERLKDIAGEFTGALDFIVSKVRTVRGTWKADETKRSRSFLLAQDWQDYLPEGIEVSADGILGLTKEDTIPVAFSAIKELAAMVKNLTTRLAALEAK